MKMLYKDDKIVTEFIEAKRLLYAMYGRKIRYILLTDHVTDFTKPVREEEGRFDIYLTSLRIMRGENVVKKLNIIGGALHEAAHVIYSQEFADPKDTKLQIHKLNLLEDIFVNHKMSSKYRGAAGFINDTYDVDDTDRPKDVWEALLALNQTLVPKAGINWQYVKKHLPEIEPDIKVWLDKCMALPSYKERVPVHKELIEKIHQQTMGHDIPNNVFGAISMLLGGGVTHQCGVIVEGKNPSSDSTQTLIVNAKLKSEQDKVEKQEEAKNRGFTPVEYINVMTAEPDTAVRDQELIIKFKQSAYRKALEKSAYDHRMLSGSLSKKKIHNFALLTNGVTRPMFKRRETGDIAHFLILLDGSGSMSQYEENVKKVVNSLAAALNERYEVIGAIFQNDDLFVAENGMPKVNFNGGTPALAAVNAAVENMKRKEGQRFVIFISDYEFDYPKPEIPNKIKFIQVSTEQVDHHWKPDCVLADLPKKIGSLIQNA
jgi:Mg-chelatase subunit ChlD